MTDAADTTPLAPSPPVSRAAESVRAWDLPTRLFHWVFVAAIACTWPSFQYAERLGDPTLKWHRYNGYAILVLIVFRVIWGFVGSSTSRWSAFLRSPLQAFGYARDQVTGVERRFLGHNPLGTYLVLAMLAAVTAQAVLGLLITEQNDTTWGPLYQLVPEAMVKRVQHWHVQGLYWVILPLIGLHISANSLYALVKHDPLIRAMITGRKPPLDYEDGYQAVIARGVMLRASGALLVAAGVVFGGIMLLGGKPFY